MRFYDVTSGEITISGYPLTALTRKSLSRAWGMVLQDTWLKTGTVRDNIRMGREDVTEKEIIAAAKAAHAHGFIQRLPDGYDTVLTEDGGSLSQGEKQLLWHHARHAVHSAHADSGRGYLLHRYPH